MMNNEILYVTSLELNFIMLELSTLIYHHHFKRLHEARQSGSGFLSQKRCRQTKGK